MLNYDDLVIYLYSKRIKKASRTGDENDLTSLVNQLNDKIANNNGSSKASESSLNHVSSRFPLHDNSMNAFEWRLRTFFRIQHDRAPLLRFCDHGAVKKSQLIHLLTYLCIETLRLNIAFGLVGSLCHLQTAASEMASFAPKM